MRDGKALSRVVLKAIRCFLLQSAVPSYRLICTFVAIVVISPKPTSIACGSSSSSPRRILNVPSEPHKTSNLQSGFDARYSCV
jgi:hypothetical protein